VGREEKLVSLRIARIYLPEPAGSSSRDETIPHEKISLLFFFSREEYLKEECWKELYQNFMVDEYDHQVARI
jgi:hypothetical protein